jgi:hypothetical protein
MFFPFFASILYIAGYAAYIFQIHTGGSVPNPASWSVWVILSALNAVTFWKGVKNAPAAAQFFAGAAANLTVFAYALLAGHFSPLDGMGKAVLILCLLVPLVWKITGKATYGNLAMGIIFAISFIPTIQGVLENPKLEQALPWYLWTAAFFITILNGVRRRKEEHEVDWRLMLFVPAVMFFAHGAVAVVVSF